MSIRKVIYSFVILLLFILIGGLIYAGFISDIETVPALYFEVSSNCPKDKPFKSPYDNKCYGCDYLHCMRISSKTEQEFSICHNRNVAKGFSCLKSCPAGWVKSDQEWVVEKECYDCSEINNIALIDLRKNICSLCNHHYDLQKNACISK